LSTDTRSAVINPLKISYIIYTQNFTRLTGMGSDAIMNYEQRS
jgi:hypothetical protein